MILSDDDHHRRRRAARRAGQPDPPLSCPSCGGPLEVAATRDARLIAICDRPACGWLLFVLVEGRWAIAERIRPEQRRRRGRPPARGGAVRRSAG
jgi:hypothetical protein